MRCIFINNSIIFIKIPFLQVVGMLVFFERLYVKQFQKLCRSRKSINYTHSESRSSLTHSPSLFLLNPHCSLLLRHKEKLPHNATIATTATEPDSQWSSLTTAVCACSKSYFLISVFVHNGAPFRGHPHHAISSDIFVP